MAFWWAALPPNRRPLWVFPAWPISPGCGARGRARPGAARPRRADFCPKLVMASRSSMVRSTSSPIVLIWARLRQLRGRSERSSSSMRRSRSGEPLVVTPVVAQLEALRRVLEVGHQAHQGAQGVAGRGQGLPGGDGAVGLDVEDQPVEVGGLLDPDRLDVEGHPVHRGEDGVDGDDPDGGGALVLVGRDVAPAPLDRHVDGQAALGVEGGDVQVGVEDLDVGRGLQVGRRGVARPALVEAQGDRLVGVHPDQQVLEVQDDVGDVLLHAGQGGELVQRLVEAHLGHRRAGNRGEQGAAQRVAQGVPEAGIERADGESLPVVLLFVDGFDGGSLDDQHRGDSCCVAGWSGAAGGRRGPTSSTARR